MPVSSILYITGLVSSDLRSDSPTTATLMFGKYFLKVVWIRSSYFVSLSNVGLTEEIS